jgi:hypothetical protein
VRDEDGLQQKVVGRGSSTNKMRKSATTTKTISTPDATIKSIKI